MKLRVGSLEAKAFILHGGELEKAIQELLGLGYLQVMTQDRNGAWLKTTSDPKGQVVFKAHDANTLQSVVEVDFKAAKDPVLYKRQLEIKEILEKHGWSHL